MEFLDLKNHRPCKACGRTDLTPTAFITKEGDYFCGPCAPLFREGCFYFTTAPLRKHVAECSRPQIQDEEDDW